ncbi:MAG: A/G-specific adenine glycosylase [Flavobacteriales bacterium]|nr:A/G-specific adenine glycosylase [Flavobacteriales bacterium]
MKSEKTTLPPFAIIAHSLMEWYGVHQRKMPWRGVSDPYRIWLSEVILQQTRVAQGTPYYLRFLERFPNVIELADAPEDAVLKTWEGLGYYSRARNLHRAAQMVRDDGQGRFPTSYSDLLNLPGVGPYTAAAIASICYDEPVVVVDGNVSRVVSRLFGLRDVVNSTAGERKVRTYAQLLLEEVDDPGGFNQAIMEFGALHCVPQNPNCLSCPLVDRCEAFRTGKVAELPVKKKAKRPENRYMVYHVVLDNGFTYLRKRPTGDVWAGLYEFILQEGQEAYEEAGKMSDPVRVVDMRHLLSHRVIHARFLIYQGALQVNDPDAMRIPWSDLPNHALSRLTTRFLENSLNITDLPAGGSPIFT